MAKKRKPSRKLRQPSRKKGRYQLNLLISDELGNQLLAEAAKSGRALSTEAVFQIESSLHTKRLLAAMATSAEEVAEGFLDHALRRTDLVLIRDSRGRKAWCEPGHPFLVSEFVAAEAGERRTNLMFVRDPITGRKAWFEPGHPLLKRSGFVAPKPGEVEAHLEQSTAASDAEIERRNAEAIRRSNLGPAFDVDAAIKRIEEVEEIAKAPANQAKKDDAA
jgi:hypothetical protein